MLLSHSGVQDLPVPFSPAVRKHSIFKQCSGMVTAVQKSHCDVKIYKCKQCGWIIPVSSLQALKNPSTEQKEELAALHHGKGLWPAGTVLLSIFKEQPEIKKVRGKAHVFPSVTSDGPSWLPHWAELSPTQPNDGVTSSQCRAHGRSCPSARCAVGTALQDFLAFLPRLFPSGYSCSTTFSS